MTSQITNQESYSKSKLAKLAISVDTFRCLRLEIKRYYAKFSL